MSVYLASLQIALWPHRIRDSMLRPRAAFSLRNSSLPQHRADLRISADTFEPE